MALKQDEWRLHRAKANFTAEAFGGATHPTIVSTAFMPPMRAVYIYVKTFTVGAARVAYTAGETFSVAGIKIVDLDSDGVVDAADDAVRTATLTLCEYWTEIRIPMKGCLRWGVELTAMETPATATNVEIWYREESADTPSET